MQYEKYKSTIRCNIEYLLSDKFPEDYPQLYKGIQKHINVLIAFNLFSIMKVGNSSFGRNVFGASVEEFIESLVEIEEQIKIEYEVNFEPISRDKKEIQKYLDMFIYLGLINEHESKY